MIKDNDVNFKADLSTWLKNKDYRTVCRYLQIINALDREWQYGDQTSFTMPHDKFNRYKITNTRDLEIILSNFHRKGIIEVTKNVNQTKPSSRPQVELWVNVIEEPKIVFSPDTQVKIIPEKFEFVRDVLNDMRKSYENLNNKGRIISKNLDFYPEDGRTIYKTAEWSFLPRSKGWALLNLLVMNKNTPYSLEEIIAKCNPNITIKKYHFRKMKDVRDTVGHIKHNLKVNKREYFPISIRENYLILDQK